MHNTNNILYGVSDLATIAWTINPATYELTLVGFLGIDLNYAQDAAFDQESGLLYLAGYAGGGALYWLDTTLWRPIKLATSLLAVMN